jgi:nucleotide-binding universal stress UspA family protein
MIKNILVGYDGQRGAQVAFRLAADLARAAQARLQLAYIEPVGDQPGVALSADMQADTFRAALPDTLSTLPEDPSEPGDVFAAIAEQCRQDGVFCTFNHLFGDPATRLSQLARVASLLAVGRHEDVPRAGAPPLGRTARQLATRMPAVLLLAAREYEPVKGLTLVYEPNSGGGRALALAGELAMLQNLTLNVVALGSEAVEPAAAAAEARTALRAYHVDGEFLPLPALGSEALQTASMTWNDPMMVLPAPPRRWLSRPLDSLRPVLLQPNVNLLLVP